MNKQIEEMARAIFETGEAIEEIDLRYACLHGADNDNETKFMRIARHLYLCDYRKVSQEGAECPTCHGTGRIGTTDWLTKNISKEQLAKEKAEAVAEHEAQLKRDVAREIFELIECAFSPVLVYEGHTIKRYIAELKKKYESEGADDEGQHS